MASTSFTLFSSCSCLLTNFFHSSYWALFYHFFYLVPNCTFHYFSPPIFLLKSVDWHLIFKLTRCIICFCSKYYYCYYDYVILLWKPSLPSFFQCLGKTKYTYLFSLYYYGVWTNLYWLLDKMVEVLLRPYCIMIMKTMKYMYPFKKAKMKFCFSCFSIP